MAGEKNRADPRITARIVECVSRLGSQAAVAKQIGVSQPGLSNWVSGMVRPPFEAVARLAEHAKVSLDWIATGVDPHANSPAYIDRFAPDAIGNAVHQPADADTIAVHKDFFSAHRLDPQRAGIVRVVGDAMSPDLNDGALVIIDMRHTSFTDEGLWVLGRPGAALVRRLVFKGDAAHLVAANKAYDDIIIKGGEQSALKIWGRVAMVLSTR